MKSIKTSLEAMVAGTDPAIQQEVALSFAVANRIYALMQQRHLTKHQLAQALGKRPSEVTKWLSGQHNFTLATLARLSTFFQEEVITVH